MDAEKQKKRAYEYRQTHEEEMRTYHREYAQLNHKAKAAHSANYKASLNKRTPSWADLDEIVKIYKECPAGNDVDHIIPLNGKLVSGLHVPRNLQYLKASINRSKKNSFDPMTFEGP